MKRIIIALAAVLFFVSLLFSQPDQFEQPIKLPLSLIEFYEIKILGFIPPEDKISPLSGKMLKIIEEIDQKWNDEKEIWQNDKAKRHIYNEEGKLEKMIQYRFLGKKKLQSGVDLYQYDEEGINKGIISKRGHQFDNEIKLINNTQIIFFYNYMDKVSREIFQHWNKGIWENNTRFDLDYDKKGELIEVTSFIWNKGSWKLRDKRTFKYDEAGKLSKEIIEEFFLKQVFSTHYIIHEYDEKGKLIKTTKQTGVIGSWKPSEYTNYHYDLRDKMTQRLIRRFNRNEWDNETVFLYVYDRQKNLKTAYEKKWVEPEGWKEVKRTKYEYKRI